MVKQVRMTSREMGAGEMYVGQSKSTEMERREKVLVTNWSELCYTEETAPTLNPVSFPSLDIQGLSSDLRAFACRVVHGMFNITTLFLTVLYGSSKVLLVIHRAGDQSIQL